MEAWTGLIWLRERWPAVVNAVTNLQFPRKAGNFFTIWERVSFSRSTLLHAVIQMLLLWFPYTWIHIDAEVCTSTGYFLHVIKEFFVYTNPCTFACCNVVSGTNACDKMIFHLRMVGRYRYKWAPVRIGKRIFHSIRFVWLKSTSTHCVGHLAMGR